jgi:hypothetical protein
MQYLKLAMAAGASIVVAAKLTPAYALPPVMPLDLNGPIRQGDMCIVPYGHPHEAAYGGIHYDGDTGPGYGRFYHCGPERHAHHSRHREHRHAAVAIAPREFRHAVYRPLDVNGPVRQGDNCLVLPRSLFYQVSDGYGAGHFERCPPDAGLARYHRHVAQQYHHRRHVAAHRHPHAHHGRPHHRTHVLQARHQRHAQFVLAISCAAAGNVDQHNDVDLRNIVQFWQPAHIVQVINTIADGIDFGADFADSGNGKTDAAAGERDNQDDGGLLTQLFDLGPQLPSNLGVIVDAQVNHSTMNHIAEAIDGLRRTTLPDNTGEPIAPALLPAAAFVQQASEQAVRAGKDAANGQIALTRAGYSSPVQSDTGMPVAIKNVVVSPLAALVGLALVIAAPLTLLATHLTVADKAAVVETVSDPMSEWYIPAAHTVTIGERAASALPAIRTAGAPLN